ncbi:hypothetical protein AA101099_1772 [Neoasaia chiangmaiensis NBRC 101099]|uniref:Uncharacterized protein n=1 Tax=Neoasaia chiangmaiensis TaxID=320497 RepID=A0A1U9KRB7_9PROT|nr:phage tail assembly protein [Neoasaia chiangmaiensis]AQS88272.1 hypothetical protein A0U93_10330 [Neoasaia chiangmaiensis]GBR39680.1 hypothetical protein AA101099_1772 [Neoasaia chiangmaiensis NBRC 101099]GEN14694.1 hypothetical protein NCH01_11250 [Neoasaia chiangmaiensis]
MTQPTDQELLAALSPVDDEVKEGVEEGVFVPPKPIETKTGQFTELRLHEPSVFAFLCATQVIGKRATLESVYDSQIDLVARVAGWPKTGIEQLGSRQLDEAIEYVVKFERDARRDLDETPDFSEQLILSFDPPIDGGGRQHGEMMLREPVVAERRRFKVIEAKMTAEASFRAEIKLVEDVSGWHPAAVMRLPISKFVKAADYLTGFFTSGQAIGSSSRLT